MKIIAITLFLVLLFSVQTSALEISVQVLDKYKTAAPGDRVQFQVTLKSIETPNRHDISLTYQLLDGSKVLTQSRELKAIETQASFISSIEIPEIDNGAYTVRVLVNDDAFAEDQITVDKTNSLKNIYYYLIIFMVVILFVGLMVWREVHKVYLLKLQHKHR